MILSLPQAFTLISSLNTRLIINLLLSVHLCGGLLIYLQIDYKGNLFEGQYSQLKGNNYKLTGDGLRSGDCL